ncbi:hypothetical protein DAEQUDRAFT_764260 [Daedalea quercina L-15889]|uniref:F-box domain-containing protein n=1 Tax=Daedalea quercina L-15889 TaxID=1314783 RepID=A0A165RQF5_9APHY|nr:hypothetical protein DAEQUDRAFT_764260 [Daedalea quercina L-15889]
MPPRLPPELLEIVLDHLHDHAATLGTCALACRAFAHIARFHRFHAVKVDSTARAIGLRELLAPSEDLGSLIQSLKLVGYYSTSISELLLYLPSLHGLVELRLSRFTFTPDSTDHALLALEFPALRRLHLHSCEAFLYRNLTALVSSIPSLDTLGIENVIVLEPGPPDDLQPPPATLRTLDLYVPSYVNYALWRQKHIFLWLLRHPAPQQIHTLRIACCSTPAPLQAMLRAYGPIDVHPPATDSDGRPGGHGETPLALSVCTQLHTVTLHYVIYSKCWPGNPHLSGIRELLAQLEAPSLTTITLSVHTSISRDQHLQSVTANHVQWVELRALDWAGLEALLLQPKFRGLERFVLNGRGSSSALRTFLRSKCPELYKRSII